MANECPVPMMSELHAKSLQHSEASHAVAGGAFVATWYSLPDVVRPAWLRGLVKIAMLAGAAVYVNHLTDDSERLVQAGKLASSAAKQAYSRCPVAKLSEPAQVVVLVSSGLVAFKLFEVIQRAIAQRARKRKDRGVRMAHTRQGLVLGTLAGVGIYLGLRK